MTDDEGYIWVGSYKKLVRLSPDLSEVKSYDSSLPVTSVNMVYKDEAGRFGPVSGKAGVPL